MAQSGWIRDSDDVSLAMVGLPLEIVQRSREAHKNKIKRGVESATSGIESTSVESGQCHIKTCNKSLCILKALLHLIEYIIYTSHVQLICYPLHL